MPALVALAVPTTLGANITEVWYCVMTKLAPMAPMSKRNKRNTLRSSWRTRYRTPERRPARGARCKRCAGHTCRKADR